jgi:hypothetical protein
VRLDGDEMAADADDGDAGHATSVHGRFQDYRARLRRSSASKRGMKFLAAANSISALGAILSSWWNGMLREGTTRSRLAPVSPLAIQSYAAPTRRTALRPHRLAHT